MTNPATPADIEDRWLFDSPVPDAAKLQTWLDAAWREILRRDRTIDTRLTAGSLVAADVTDVVVAMTLRVLGNPEGKKQEAIDDYSWTRDAAVSAGALYVTDAELASLAAPRTTGTRNSVRLIAYGEL